MAPNKATSSKLDIIYSVTVIDNYALPSFIIEHYRFA